MLKVLKKSVDFWCIALNITQCAAKHLLHTDVGKQMNNGWSVHELHYAVNVSQFIWKDIGN